MLGMFLLGTGLFIIGLVICIASDFEEYIGWLLFFIGMMAMLLSPLALCESECDNKPQKPQTTVCCCECKESQDNCNVNHADEVNIKYCPHCGELIDKTHCSQCNEPINEGDKFCTNCGNAVEFIEMTKK